jgi:hypothetical protein
MLQRKSQTMASDFYQKRVQQIAHMHLPTDQAIAECIVSLAIGLDKTMDEVQAVRDLIIRIEREHRGLP